MPIVTATGAGARTTHTDLQSVADALAAGQKAIRDNGQPMTVTDFMGGTLLDYLPMNVYLWGQWFEGQKELLQSYWDNGTFPKPDAVTLGLPVVPLPEQFGGAASTSWGTIALVGVGAFLLMRKKRG